MIDKKQMRINSQVLSLKKVLAVAFFAFALAVILPTKASFAIDRNNWMSEIYDDAKISWLSIPGTHDSTAFNVKNSMFAIHGLIEKGGTTQSMNIESQLAAGVRAFDLRYKWENGKFYLYHGENKYACKCRDSNGSHLDLETVFKKFQTFLKAHPNEFILANIQKESGSYNNSGLNNLISTYGIVGRSNSATIGSVRGKIVNGSAFMQGISGSSAYNRWETTVSQKVSDMKTCFNAAPSISKYYTSSITQKCICTNISWQGKLTKLTTWPKDYASDVRKKFFDSNPFKSYGQKAYGVILYDFPTNSVLDMTISANDWAKCANYTVKFDTGKGTKVANSTAKEGRLLTKPSTTPTLNGYTFAGWYKNQACTSSWNFATDKVTSNNTTLYAKWTPVKYTISYSGVSGATNPNSSKTSYTIETSTYALKDPTRKGYTFKGWFDQNSKQVTSIEKGTTGNITLTARWEINTYTVSYTGLDGSDNPNISKTKYNVLSASYTMKEPNKKGWTFRGWYDQNSKNVAQIKTGDVGNLYLTARWDPNNYTITYSNIEGANNPNTETGYAVYSDNIILDDATKVGYNFEGWYDDDDNKVNEIVTGSAGDLNLTAEWSLKEYAINYRSVKSSENPNTVTNYNIEYSTIELKDPSRNGYTFVGWYDADGNKVTKIEAGSHQDYLLIANWQANKHTITYENLQGAENPNVTGFNYETETFKLKNPTREGYNFDGWFTKEGCSVTEIAEGTNTDIVLYARWTPKTYAINYANVDGAQNPNTQTTYTIESSTIKLKDCKKDGYIFDGWYTKQGTTTSDWGKKVTEIKTGSTGDVTVYAKWTKKISMLRLYNPNSGEHFYTSDGMEFDSLVSLGWVDEGEGWLAPATSNKPVYRLYNPNSGDHHYTTSTSEKTSLTKAGWKYEGIGWYSADASGIALYRQYNPNAKVGSHNYTTSLAENNKLVKIGWKAEGVGWYGLR